jgi:hypothetical protein
VRAKGAVRVDVEQHAVCFAVAKRLAPRIRLAERLTRGEGVLGAAGLEVVCGRALYVRHDAAAWPRRWRTR